MYVVFAIGVYHMRHDLCSLLMMRLNFVSFSCCKVCVSQKHTVCTVVSAFSSLK